VVLVGLPRPRLQGRAKEPVQGQLFDQFRVRLSEERRKASRGRSSPRLRPPDHDQRRICLADKQQTFRQAFQLTDKGGSVGRPRRTQDRPTNGRWRGADQGQQADGDGSSLIFE
jgi:hypothetical protein